MALKSVTRFHYIYLLIDPLTQEVRYVGVTVQPPHRRLTTHLSCARHRRRTARDKWIAELLQAGNKPMLEVIEKTHDRDREVYWLRYYRFLGCNLTNVMEGGSDGFLGRSVSVFTRERIRRASIKRWEDPECRQRMLNSMRGHPVSDKTKQKISRANTGKKHLNRKMPPCSEEQKKKLSAIFKGRRFSYAPGTHITSRKPELFRGERKWAAKLTEDQVREMRARFAAGGISKQELSRQYGLALGTASSIINRKKWKHVS